MNLTGSGPQQEMTNPNSAYAQPDAGLPPDACNDPDDFDAKDWIMQRIHLNDPVELRRSLTAATRRTPSTKRPDHVR